MNSEMAYWKTGIVIPLCISFCLCSRTFLKEHFTGTLRKATKTKEIVSLLRLGKHTFFGFVRSFVQEEHRAPKTGLFLAATAYFQDRFHEYGRKNTEELYLVAFSHVTHC